MAFQYHPVVGGEAFEVAARFGEAADARLAPLKDDYAWAEAIARIWSDAIDLGWPLMMVPETAGGVGGTLEDAAALIEGAARFALAVPLTKALVMLPRLIDDEMLAWLTSGDIRVGLSLEAAYPWARGARGPASLELRQGRLSGRALGVELPPGATHLLIAAGDRLVLLPAGSADIRTHRRIDGRLAGDLSFDNAVPERLFAPTGIADALDLGALMACIEITAGAATVIEDCVRYLNEREQFGVKLSSFQVLRHYVADMYIAFQNAHALTSATLRSAIAGGQSLPRRDIALTKLRVGEVGRFVAETAIQVHGGMGMTEENRATRIGKRLMLADLEWGDRSYQAESLLKMDQAA